MITIFTPTYNRFHTLPKLYESLLKQNDTNFEWIIVNDGSTDQTDTLIKSYIQEKKLSIKYVEMPNGGKHRAINKGVQMASGDLFFIVDSDDYLSNDAVERIGKEGVKINSNEWCGLCFRRMNLANEFIGGETSINTDNCSMLDLFYKLKLRGDMALVFYTSILKTFPFPEIRGETFVPEGLIWTRITQKYRIRFVNYGIYFAEYLPDGLSRNFNINIKKNPIGFSLYYGECLKYKEVPFVGKCIFLVRYAQCMVYRMLKKQPTIPKV